LNGNEADSDAQHDQAGKVTSAWSFGLERTNYLEPLWIGPFYPSKPVDVVRHDRLLSQ
jgi:hypothetical protein